MEKIRKNVFETNSSSSHSIHIEMDSELLDTSLIPDENGVLHITGYGEYGWEYEKYNDARTKTDYAVVYSHYEDSFRDMLLKVLKKQTGAKQIEISGDGDGYIDHQSNHTLSVIKTEEELRMFIFNKKSWLFGGNDNSDASPDYYADKNNHKFKINIYDKSNYREQTINELMDIKNELVPICVSYSLTNDIEEIFSTVDTKVRDFLNLGWDNRSDYDEKKNSINFTNTKTKEEENIFFEIVKNPSY